MLFSLCLPTAATRVSTSSEQVSYLTSSWSLTTASVLLYLVGFFEVCCLFFFIPIFESFKLLFFRYTCSLCGRSYPRALASISLSITPIHVFQPWHFPRAVDLADLSTWHFHQITNKHFKSNIFKIESDLLSQTCLSQFPPLQRLVYLS